MQTCRISALVHEGLIIIKETNTFMKKEGQDKETVVTEEIELDRLVSEGLFENKMLQQMK